MHSRDDDSLFALHDRRKRLRPPKERSARGGGRVVSYIAPGLYGRGIDDGTGSCSAFGSVRAEEFQPCCLKTPGFRSRTLVGAADLIAQFQKQCRNAAHAASRDADKMDAFRAVGVCGG